MNILQNDIRVDHHRAMKEMQKLNRQYDAHMKGKRTRIVIPNPNTAETNQRMIAVSGNEYWGPAKK